MSTPRTTHSTLPALLALLTTLITGLQALAGPRNPTFESWTTLGDYERTALEQQSSFRMILPTREAELDVAFHPVAVLADAYEAVVVDPRGALRTSEPPEIATFTGIIAEEMDRSDFAKLARLPDGRVTGLLRILGVLYELRSEPRFDNAVLRIQEISPATLRRVLEGSAVPLPAGLVAAAAPASGELPAAVPGLREIELATEADARFVARSGGPARANARILAIVHAMNGFYETDLGLTNRVVFQRAWSRRDPYTTKDADALLRQFQARFASDVSTPHDDAQLFSGRNFRGRTLGRSFGASTCGDNRYGVNQARNLSESAVALLVAHHEAHNLGAGPSETGIMAPRLGADATLFSEASRFEITSFVSGAGCFQEPAVAELLMLDPVGPQRIAEGELLDLQLLAFGTGGDAVRFDAVPLPPGASVDSDGRFLYAPPYDTVGCGGSKELMIALLASDSGGSEAREIVSIVISDRPTGTAPVFEDPRDVVVEAGQRVWIPLVATDADADSLRFASTNRPEAAFLDPGGLFAWQPTSADVGLHLVSFVVSDCTGRSSAQSVSIQVIPAPAPQLTSLAPGSGSEGTLVEIQGTGFVGDLEVRFGTTAAPVRSASATRLVVQAPPLCGDPSTVDVSVSRGGIAAAKSLTFTYLGAGGSASCPQASTSAGWSTR